MAVAAIVRDAGLLCCSGGRAGGVRINGAGRLSCWRWPIHPYQRGPRAAVIGAAVVIDKAPARTSAIAPANRKGAEALVDSLKRSMGGSAGVEPDRRTVETDGRDCRRAIVGALETPIDRVRHGHS